jgi:hypothetical protein
MSRRPLFNEIRRAERAVELRHEALVGGKIKLETTGDDAFFSPQDVLTIKAKDFEMKAQLNLKIEASTNVAMSGSNVTLKGGGVLQIFAKIGDEGLEAVRTALHEVVTNRFGDGPIRVTNVATIGVGTADS